MDTEALKIVALVAQQGSLAGAARVLNLDPSSVSRTVAGLGARLGLRIFERTTRSLRATEAGETYLRRVVPLIEELDRAREEAGRTRTDASGTLRMTAYVAFAQECILPHLGAFQNAHPKLSVELLPSDANIDIAAEGIDLAIRLTDAPLGDLTATRRLRTRYRVCAAPAYLARFGRLEMPEDLANRDCLRFALREYRSRWLFREGRKETRSSGVGQIGDRERSGVAGGRARRARARASGRLAGAA